MPAESWGYSPAPELPGLQTLIEPNSPQKESVPWTRALASAKSEVTGTRTGASWENCWLPCRTLNGVQPHSPIRTNSRPLEPQNVTLFENRVFAEAVSQDLKKKSSNNVWCLFFFFLVLFRATLAAYRSSHARGPIGATAAGLRHSHCNARSKLCL